MIVFDNLIIGPGTGSIFRHCKKLTCNTRHVATRRRRIYSIRKGADRRRTTTPLSSCPADSTSFPRKTTVSRSSLTRNNGYVSNVNLTKEHKPKSKVVLGQIGSKWLTGYQICWSYEATLSTRVASVATSLLGTPIPEDMEFRT